MVRRPAAATWIPLAAFLVLVAVSAGLTATSADRPGARLLVAVERFCAAVSEGEYERALDHVAGRSRSPLNAQRLARVVAERRGATWMVVAVDPDQGTTSVIWGQVVTARPVAPEVLRWAPQPDGAWKLVL